jgi:GNAT superfamily N-acetyltransferase
VQVRLATEADADHVATLMAAFRDWWGRDEPTDDQLAVGVAGLLVDRDTEFLLAVPPAGGPAGICQLRYRYGLWYDAPDCWLEDMYVDADARGLGVGRALGEAAIERARERGCRRVQLDVNEANPEALALYRRLEFDSLQDPPGGRLLLMTRWVT